MKNRTPTVLHDIFRTLFSSLKNSFDVFFFKLCGTVTLELGGANGATIKFVLRLNYANVLVMFIAEMMAGTENYKNDTQQLISVCTDVIRNTRNPSNDFAHTCVCPLAVAVDFDSH